MANTQMKNCSDSFQKDDQHNAFATKYHVALIGIQANGFMKMKTSSNGMVVEKWSRKKKLDK